MRFAAEKVGGLPVPEAVGILEAETEISERMVIAWAVWP